MVEPRPSKDAKSRLACSLAASTRNSNNSLKPSIALSLARARAFAPSGVVSLPCRWSWERESAIASSRRIHVGATPDHREILARVDGKRLAGIEGLDRPCGQRRSAL